MTTRPGCTVLGVGRQCERPGCTRIAEATYSIDVGRLVVTLSRLDDPDQRAGLLCLGHAAAMTVPRNWSLDDRRESAPPLFRLPKAPERASPKRRHPSGGLPPARPAEQLRLVVDQANPPEAEPDADPTVVLPWRPSFDDRDDLDGLLSAESPLLSRAFGVPRPRR